MRRRWFERLPCCGRRSRLRAVGRTLAAYHVWLKVLALLVAFTAWVEWSFVPSQLVPRYHRPLPIVAFPSEDAGVMFELLPARAAADDVLVVTVGDSTMAGLFGVGTLSGPLYMQLARRFPGRHVQIIDLSIRGLYARDAVLLIARALALEPDVLLYAVSPRVLPFATEPGWATTVEDVALDPHIVARLGLMTSASFVEPSHLARTVVYSYWPVARLRGALAQALLEQLPAGVAAALRPFVAHPTAPAFAEEARDGDGGARWTRARFGFDRTTLNTRAFDEILQLCRRDGRCLLYHPPVNPASTHGFEAGFDEAFLSEVAGRTTAAGVRFLDLHARIPSEHFILQPNGPDALHLKNEGARVLAETLAAAVEPEIARAPR